MTKILFMTKAFSAWRVGLGTSTARTAARRDCRTAIHAPERSQDGEAQAKPGYTSTQPRVAYNESLAGTGLT